MLQDRLLVGKISIKQLFVFVSQIYQWYQSLFNKGIGQTVQIKTAC